MKLYIRYLLSISILAVGLGRSWAQSADEGKTLFEQNCQACHLINEDATGPALKGIETRRPMDWIIKWVKNSQGLIKSGDAYANELSKKWGGAVMPPFGSLKDDQIKAIVEYVKVEAKKGPEKKDDGKGKEAAAGAANGEENKDKGGDSFYTITTLIILLAMAIILLLVTMVLGRVNHSLKRQLAAKDPEGYGDTAALEGRSPFWRWVDGWNKTVATIAFMMVFGFVMAIYGFDYANKEVGVQKGYAPIQPINFSHKIHAGDHKINCQYCHSTVEKSKQASIPGVNTCMNCHLAIQAKDKYNGQLSPEIAKIYKAAGYNTETRSYDLPQKPIRWVRIHNLPDLAYFNHAQHVKVGKVACQKCHGEIQNMSVVYQRNSLQMGWCVNCHRESNVDVANNAYYLKLHEDMKKNKKSDIKVAENGGLECSKCHY